MTTTLLKFGQGNAKLDTAIYTFSLPAGHFCPFAHQCLSKADRNTGKISDGPHTTFRCFSASQEARQTSTRNAHWHNAQLLRGCRTTQDMAELLLASLSQYAGYVRLHVSGDYFSQSYFDAWLHVARLRPQTRFYGYTKSLPYWIRRLQELPDNLALTASLGGKHDDLVDTHQLPCARVVFSKEEARLLGLEIDHDDSLAIQGRRSFALLLHGTQPAGTPAAKALSVLHAHGEFGYGKRSQEIRHQHAA